MSEVRNDISQVLATMRQVRSQVMPSQVEGSKMLASQMQDVGKPDPLGMQALEKAIAQNTESLPVPSFTTLLKNAIDQSNQLHRQAGTLQTAFTQEDPNVDLPEVMVAMQKASVSFQAMTQVRNKVVTAYQEIMNMPI